MDHNEYSFRKQEFSRSILELAITDPIVSACVEAYAHGNMRCASRVQDALTLMVETLSREKSVVQKMLQEVLTKSTMPTVIFNNCSSKQKEEARHV